MYCFFREADDAPVREEVPLPSTDKEKEDHFKRFFHSVSGEVIHALNSVYEMKLQPLLCSKICDLFLNSTKKIAFEFKKLVKYTIINLTKGPECCFTLILHFNYNKCISFVF